MSDKIKEALGKLDVGNDNHWTQDGQAKLETVKFLNGGEAVTRETLEKDFPGFNKTTAAAYFMSTGTPTPPAAPPAPPAPEQGEPGHTAPTNIKPSAEQGDDKVERPGDPAAVGEDNGNPTGVDANGAPSAQLTPGVDVNGKATADTDAHGNLIGVDANDVPSAVVVHQEGSDPTAPFNPAHSEPTRAPGTSGLVAAAGLTDSPRDNGAGAAAQASQPGDGGASEREAAQAEQQAVAERIAGTDEVEDLEEELEEVEQDLEDLNLTLDDMNKRKDELNKHADMLRGRVGALKHTSGTGTIQAYLESRKEAMAIRGDNIAALKASGLTLKGITRAVSAAPIDAAMSRKTARGGKRPQRV